MAQERGEVSCDWWRSDTVLTCDWLQAQAALERVKEESAAVSAALGEQRAAAETVTAEREQLRRENEQLQQTIAEKDQGRCQRNFVIHNIGESVDTSTFFLSLHFHENLLTSIKLSGFGSRY